MQYSKSLQICPQRLPKFHVSCSDVGDEDVSLLIAKYGDNESIKESCLAIFAAMQFLRRSIGEGPTVADLHCGQIAKASDLTDLVFVYHQIQKWAESPLHGSEDDSDRQEMTQDFLSR
jgi:hypothetical protein